MTINPICEPYAAAGWLVSRHRTIQRLLDRIDGWIKFDSGNTMPDVELVAQVINESDQYNADWLTYERGHRPPLDEAGYERWQDAGPKPPNDRVAAYGPMSGGEKRMLRMLAVLAPVARVRFNLCDSDGVDQGYAEDWRLLIAGKVTVQ